jgi:serine kinase of HPr protein (carbohydrate metabolism regulator)
MIVRLATNKDMFTIIVFTQELTNYEKLAHICEATNAKLLESNL